ncbi:hypothetical protein EIN_095450 [Entamoeba invadens IP1]|uniref:Rap-GAP domain-containing protein n=1 Tax=Entamoeba invadens IP1 TaxID=370355 RepID=A0A0A1U3G3_ENTIV|nr:hypothetical protein EIN_095450 [Entamoeba invadens IP1]ELP87288.1 hypothetical protein EIN_095450 [Entamoeba invadens IP1]|eukprot:XP_004254059.1 hypothetical protein EIN_095450 [Entamoeba invadens IP1]
MFTSKAQELGLLTPSNETDVLSIFESKTQSGIVGLVCADILKNKENLNKFFLSKSHTTWLLEVIGAGLQLNLSDSTIITQCIDLYEKWFVKNENVPDTINTNRAAYLEECLLQLTLIFSHEPKVAEYPIYETLCMKTLKIFEFLYPSIRTTKIENVFVRALIAVAENVFCSKNTIILNETFKFLNVVWTCFSSKENELWDILKKCYVNWITNKTVALIWKDTMISLQNSLVEVLTSQSDEHVITTQINQVDYTVTFTSTYLLTFYLKFLHITGNLCNVENADVHHRLILGIGKLVDGLLKTVLSGNDIMRIFCDILYQTVVYKDHRTFTESVLDSISIFVTIFLTKKESYDMNYLYKTQSALSKCLTSINLDINIGTVEHLINLFNVRPELSSMLSGDIMFSLCRIAKEAAPTPQNKKNILTLLQQIQMIFTPRRDSLQQNTVSLLQQAIDVVFSIIKIDPEHCDDVFVTMNRILVSIVSLDNKGMNVNKFLNLFVKEFDNNSGTWLLQISQMGNPLCEFLKNILAYKESVDFTILKDIFTIMQKRVMENSEEPQKVENLLSVFSLFYSVCLPQLSHEQLLFTNAILDKVIKTIQNDSTLAEFDFDIKLQNILYETNQKSFLDNQITETFVTKELEKRGFTGNDFIHVYYVFENSVISIIEVPWYEKVIVILRNRYGKAVYSFLMDDENEEWKMGNIPVGEEREVKALKTISPKWIKSGENEVDEIEKMRNENNKTQYGGMGNGKLQLPFVVCEKTWKEMNCDVLNPCFRQRILSSVLNYNHMTNSPVEELVSNEELFKELGRLDGTSCLREFDVIVKAEQATHEYLEFVGNLGVLETVKENDTQRTELRYLSDGVLVNYHVDILNTNNNRFRDMRETDVLISWGCSSDKCSDQSQDNSLECGLTITITPTTSELYMVSLNSKVGLCLENQLCSFEVMSSLIKGVVLARANESETKRSAFTERNNILLSVASFLDTKYTCVATHSLFSNNHLKLTKPVDFKNVTVFAFPQQITKKTKHPSNITFTKAKSPNTCKNNLLRSPSPSSSRGFKTVVGILDKTSPPCGAESTSPTLSPSPNQRVTMGLYRKKFGEQGTRPTTMDAATAKSISPEERREPIKTEFFTSRSPVAVNSLTPDMKQNASPQFISDNSSPTNVSKASDTAKLPLQNNFMGGSIYGGITFSSSKTPNGTSPHSQESPNYLAGNGNRRTTFLRDAVDKNKPQTPTNTPQPPQQPTSPTLQSTQHPLPPPSPSQERRRAFVGRRTPASQRPPDIPGESN